MDIYVLDRANRKTVLIDTYESFIWTERYAAIGDFELVIASTSRNRRLFAKGARIVINESVRMMTVDTVEDTADESGQFLLTIKGRSMEYVLLDRIARPNNNNLTTTPKWIVSGTPAAIARKLYYDICVTGVLSPRDVFPHILASTPSTATRIPEPTDTVKIELEPAYLYDALREICLPYDLGFRIIQINFTNEFRFQIYTGHDRTAGQNQNEAVIFTPGLDNLIKTTSFVTTREAKNFAYVTSKAGIQIVPAPGVSVFTGSMNRRMLLVNVTDLEEGMSAEQITAYLNQRGKEELAKHRELFAFDGEISQSSQYVYNKHYGLGDLVTMQNEDGESNTMMVAEQIFVSDGEGVRSYPTLTFQSYNPGDPE